MKRLLHKPLRAFALYAFFVLTCSIPAYYFLVNSIWIDELREHNEILKEQIRVGFNKTDTSELRRSIVLWNKIQSTGRISLAEKNVPSKDSTYFIQRITTHEGETESDRFAGLTGTILIHGAPYRLTVETNVEQADETVLAISYITGVFFVLLIGGFIFLNAWLSKRIWKPFYEVLEKLQHYNLESDKLPEFNETDIQEFKALNDALENLITNSLRTYRQQKEFTQNASHELQTPLAVLKSKLDLLIQDDTLSPAQRATIASLDNSILRVTRINKNLLLLAKIEHQDYTTQMVDLSALLHSGQETYGFSAADKHIELIVRIEPKIMLEANESLAEILIANLVSNALRHTEADGHILIRLDKKHFSIQNSGQKPLNKASLFRRFSTASNDTAGSGLGLAIVKQICDKYGWKIDYDFLDGKHIFSVFF